MYFNELINDQEQYIENKEEIKKLWTTWLLEIKDWKSFLTLTFRDEIPYDTAKKKFASLIRVLNQELFGKRYMNKVGGSYFSYVIGSEYQARGVIHFHVLIDRPVNFQKIQMYWNMIAGFALIGKIKNNKKAVDYIIKYAVKDGTIDQYIARKKVDPGQYPLWWFE